ncbi:MAG: alpha/beta hydrolase [Oligoflexales bacterium]
MFKFISALILVFNSLGVSHLSRADSLQRIDLPTDENGDENCLDRIGPEGEEYILEPKKKSVNLEEKVLIILPGGLVPNHHYLALAEKVQEQTSSKLWVGIVSCKWTANLCNPLDQGPLGVRQMVTRLIKKISKKAGKEFNNSDVFLGGHSLGGQGAFAFANDYPGIGGVLLWASYVNKDLTNFDYPILTLGAELNGGQTKLARIALYYSEYEEIAKKQGEAYAIKRKPVVIIPGINHSDFCPGFSVKGDLESEVDPDFAIEKIAEVSASFLDIHTSSDISNVDSGLQMIKGALQDTKSLSEPFLKARSLEQSGNWCQKAQLQIAGPEFDSRLAISPIIADSALSFMSGHTNTELDTSGVLKLDVVSYAKYPQDILRLGKLISADEIACKMVSKEKIATDFFLNISAGKASCKQLNEMALKYASNLVSPRVWQRYVTKGKKIEFEDDMTAAIGPQFVFLSSLKYQEEETSLKVTSPILFTGIDSRIYPGNHYCKVLSPARAVEWISTDSLPLLSTED